MSGPIPNGAQVAASDREQDREKRARAGALERRRWWELQELVGRCKTIAEKVWGAELARATVEQETLAARLRDRTAEGLRATGATFQRDTGIEVPILTPHARLVFLEKVVAGLLIYAERQHLPVTPEGKRAVLEVEAAGEVTEAELDREAHELADAEGMR